MKFFCEYCGNRIDANVDRKCPNCGASYKRNKNFIKMQEENNKQHEINNEFKNEVMNHTLGVMKVSKFIFVIPIVVFLVIFSIVIFSFISFNKNFKNDSENMQNNVESIKDEINNTSKKEDKKITVGFNEYGEVKDYKFKVYNYQVVEDRFRKAGEGYELVKFYFMLGNLSNEELTKEDVYCIVDEVAQTNEISSGYSDLPMFVAKDLTVKGTATFIVPKNATSYDIRYGDYITVHIEK